MEKVALVTGSSSGIGLETALSLTRDGYHTFASILNWVCLGSARSCQSRLVFGNDFLECSPRG